MDPVLIGPFRKRESFAPGEIRRAKRGNFTKYGKNGFLREIGKLIWIDFPRAGIIGPFFLRGFGARKSDRTRMFAPHAKNGGVSREGVFFRTPLSRIEPPVRGHGCPAVPRKSPFFRFVREEGDFVFCGSLLPLFGGTPILFRPIADSRSSVRTTPLPLGLVVVGLCRNSETFRIFRRFFWNNLFVS